MKVILPVSHRDGELALKLAAQIALLGNVESYEALVVSNHKGREFADGVTAIFQTCFATTNLVEVPNQCENNGHVQAANHMFRSTANYLENSGNQMPWYWLEADNTLLDPNWLRRLDSAYYAATENRKFFMGHVKPTPSMARDGSVSYPNPEDTFMVGSGIYPPNLSRYSRLWQTAQVTPWDTYIRFEIKKFVQPTPLIAHNWNTLNYRVVDGKLICDKGSEQSHSTTEPEFNKAAVVFHGCKDGSLLDLVASVVERSTK